MVAPIGFIFAAAGIRFVVGSLNIKNWIAFTLLIITIVFNLRPWDIYRAHNPNSPARLARIHNTSIYKSLDTTLPIGTKLVLNTNNFEDIDLMFYHNELTAYSWCMNEQLIDSIKKENVP